MDISIELPLDADGFLRRECPTCGGQFKWHHGPANAEAEEQAAPDEYFCPLCSAAAPLDAWWTEEQAAHAREAALPAVLRAAQEAIGEAIQGSKFLTFTSDDSEQPGLPAPLAETDDMVMVASPCHPYEPVKVPEDHLEALHCLICGTAYAV